MDRLPARRLSHEIDVAMWDLEVGEVEPGPVVLTLLMRLRRRALIAEERSAVEATAEKVTGRFRRLRDFAFEVRRGLGLDRGGIQWE